MSDDTAPDPGETEHWTDEARGRFADSSRMLIDALIEHRRVVLAAGPDDPRETVLDPGEAVVDAALACVRDQWNLTEELSPFFPLEDFYLRGDDDDDDDDEELPPTDEVGRVTVLYRRDYQVEDLDRLRAAGRAAFLELQPDAEERLSPEHFQASLDSMGALLYHVSHAQGIDALGDLETTGLALLGGLTLYVDFSDDESAQADEDGDPFAVEGTVIYTERWA